MTSKRENLVAGRLDAGPPGNGHGKDVASGARLRYGYERLGITSDATGSAGTAAAPEPSARPYAAKPADRPQAQEPSQVRAQAPAAPPPPQPDARQRKRFSLLDRLPRAARGPIDWITRDKARAILAAGSALAAGILAVTLVVWNKGTGGAMSPRTAVAEAQPLAKAQVEAQAPAPRQQGNGGAPADTPSTGNQTKLNVWEVLSPQDYQPTDRPRQRDTVRPSTDAKGPPTPAPQQEGPAPVRYRSCPPGFCLNGIVNTPSGPMANINGRFVPVGGEVNGATVVQVRAYSVEMELDGERFLLGMGSSPQK